MHLRDSTQLTIAVVISAFLWLGIMMTLTMSDYLTRQFLTFG